MSKKELKEKNDLLENCISEILESENPDLVKILGKYPGVSITQLLSYCSDDTRKQKALNDLTASFITSHNPTIDEYLVLFQKENKDPLDAVLFGLNDVAKPFRRNPDSSVLKKLEADMTLMKKYKEPYLKSNRYGILDTTTNEPSFAEQQSVDKTVLYIEEHHKSAIERLGFIPNFLVNQYINGLLKHNSEPTLDETSKLSREDLIARIEQKMSMKKQRTSEIRDMDRYIEFMEGQNEREEK